MAIKYKCQMSSVDKRVSTAHRRSKRLESQLKKEYQIKKKRDADRQQREDVNPPVK